MTWIRFDHGEEALPDPESLLPFQDENLRAGAGLSTQRVVFFSHGWSCKFCREWMLELSTAFRLRDVGLLVVVPSQDELPAEMPAGLHFLVDPQRRLWEAYAAIFEFELPGELMIFVLNSYGVPVRAWVGAEAPQSGSIEQIGQALDFIEIQCPE